MAAPQFVLDHIDKYIKTGGEDGYWFDARPYTDGKAYMVETLLLKTIGRKSGKPVVVPLHFSRRRGEIMLIASNGGAQTHPAWYLNMEANPKVTIQIKNKVWKGTTRFAQGEERKEIWQDLTDAFPHFIEYKTRTPREFPFVLIKPETETGSVYD